ncbi:hypothetical protein EJ06DRAFT_525112 [Trichodelitschia bisporula]|uniref:Uncharacterized protein n=1 Tax=Trichodelitschia bisporula TaxID=703511 RepID=A0A6G1HIQ3_9PEZI|nr:hypothetical protein EJ06DRAFT_525112 [Trichodelitschia bisporula]
MQHMSTRDALRLLRAKKKAEAKQAEKGKALDRSAPDASSATDPNEIDVDSAGPSSATEHSTAGATLVPSTQTARVDHQRSLSSSKRQASRKSKRGSKFNTSLSSTSIVACPGEATGDDPA